jgi:hypothetical protein
MMMTGEKVSICKEVNMNYFTTLYRFRLYTDLRIVVNTEIGRMWKEVVEVRFKVYHRI